MWEAVLVLVVGGIGVSRFADVINEILSPFIPMKLGTMKLSGQRVVLWVVAAIFGYIGVVTIGYDPLDATGVASGADDIWNILTIVAITDAADAFFRDRLLRR